MMALLVERDGAVQRRTSTCAFVFFPCLVGSDESSCYPAQEQCPGREGLEVRIAVVPCARRDLQQCTKVVEIDQAVSFTDPPSTIYRYHTFHRTFFAECSIARQVRSVPESVLQDYRKGFSTTQRSLIKLKISFPRSGHEMPARLSYFSKH